MIQKHPIYPQRMRRIPSQFSWVDHRLVRDRHIESCSHPASALYLFLVTVADDKGLSYYSDPSVMTRLGMDAATLHAARQNLIRIGLIAYQSPVYQVLSLEPWVQADQTRRHKPEQMSRALPIGKIFKQMMGDGS